MTIGKRISELRKAMGYSQEYIAEQLGVSRQAVSKWEQDLSSPSTGNLLNLAQLFNISADELLYMSTEQSSALEEYAQRKLMEEQKRDEKKILWIKRIKRILILVARYVILYFACSFLDYQLGKDVLVFNWMTKRNVLQITCVISIMMVFLELPRTGYVLLFGSLGGVIIGQLIGSLEAAASAVGKDNSWLYYLIGLYAAGIIGLWQEKSVWREWNRVVKVLCLVGVGFTVFISLYVGLIRIRESYGAHVGYQAGYEVGVYDAENGYEIHTSYDGSVPDPFYDPAYWDPATKGYMQYFYEGYLDGFNEWTLFNEKG